MVINNGHVLFSAPPLEHVYPNLLAETQPVPQVINVTTVMTTLGPHKTRLHCPHCQADVTTTTKRHPSVKAYVASALLCFFG